MVKGVGVVNQALAEAFQILKQVPYLVQLGESEGLGDKVEVWGGQ